MTLLHSKPSLAILLSILALPALAPPGGAVAKAPTPAPAARRAPADTTARTPFPYPGDATVSAGGASLRLVETGRKRTPGTIEVDYRLEGGHFPRGKVYRLWQMSLGGPPEPLCGALVADSTGALVPDAQAAVSEATLCPEFDLIQLGAYQYMPGEPYRVAIISTDDSVRAVATAFPHPIEGSDGPHRILLEMNSADQRSFTIWGGGFGRDQGLRTSMTTGGETFEGGAFSDAQGVVRILLNAPPGAPGGVVTYEVRGTGGRPQLTYRWGQVR
jgi:hypothetical protein